MTRVYKPTFASLGKALTYRWHRLLMSQRRPRVLSRLVAAVDGGLRRALCIMLVVSLLATSTPAAPQTILAVTGEWHSSLGFWFRANHVPSKLYRVLTGQNPERAKRQEKQEDRDIRVRRIRIHPGDVTLRVEERINLAAVAYDQDDGPVGGVQFTWEAQDEDRSDAAVVSPNGEFEALVPGRFKVTVQGAGKTDHVRITVREGQRRKKDEAPVRTTQTSTRDLPLGTVDKSATPVGRATRAGKGIASAVRRGHVFSPGPALPSFPDDGWNSSNYWSADDPGNQPGTPPGAPLDDGAGSGNFQLAAPIYSSSGRGVTIALAAAYNSRLWNKAGSQITYDIDRGWPAPGWSLGFGKIVSMGSGGSMLIDADGTRHGLSGTLATYTWGQRFEGHTTDGTLIDYGSDTDTTGALTSAWAKLPNGTIVSYYTVGLGVAYPTGILDPNGNYVTITYVNNSGPQIQTITDTLNRAITFHYDSNNLLTAIQAPGYNGGPGNNAPPRTLVRLHYKHQPLTYSFPGLTTVVRDSNPWVIDAIYYPATNTGYWFGDPDSYSTYGMLAKVIEQRNMTFSASSLNDMGTVGQGVMTRQELYNYPLSTDSSGGSNLTDAPTYTSMTESWTRDGTVTTDQAVTSYEVNQNSSPRTVTVTLPNGTRSLQHSYNAPGQYNDGLVYYDETRDSVGVLLQSSSSTWLPGAYDSPRPTRVEATNESLQKTATEFSYGTVYNQVTEVRNYDYGGTTLLGSTRTQYQNSTAYTNNHILNLPLVVETFAADNVTRVLRTEYQYDGQTLTNTQGVVMHSASYDPYAPQVWVPTHCVYMNQYGCQQWEYGHWVSAYQPSTDNRGNVTQVTSYANVTTGSATIPITETRRYDITGNVVTASTSCCQATSFSYTTATQYAYPLSQTRGSATDPYAQLTTGATYDFNTGLILSATDANGRESTTSYDASTLRPITSIAPTFAHTDYSYNDAAMTVTSTTYAGSGVGAIADQNVKLLNGRGQVRQEQARAPDSGSTQVWDYADITYNNLGQVVQQSQPYRSGQTQQLSTATYDALGRTTRVTAPDGSVTETYYNEKDFDPNDSYVPQRPGVASSAAGETTLVRDAWGRERWGRTDAQGRLVEVVEPNPAGSGSVSVAGALLTTYTYNTLGNLIQVIQGAQTRSFKYDSLGRLLAQKLAETSATLNDAGAYQAGGGTWSDVFTYDDRSNVTSRTDARGVKTVYNYNGDPLNRLQSVSWDTSGFGDSTNPILSAATVSYQYRTKSSGSQLRDVTQPSGVTTTGISTESYSYDSEDRVSSKSLTLTSRPSHPFVTDYIYDPLDRVEDVRYPVEYGNGAQPRKLVHHTYDIASRLTSLTVDGATHASNLVYNAASQTTSLGVGASGPNQIVESYNYDQQTGLLASQTAARFSNQGNPIFNLSYDYAGTNGKRTGQLTKILNNLNHNKDRGYTYDALGRLITAQGGPPTGTLWTQNYSYDRYGNRTSVSASGSSARNQNGKGMELAKAGRASILPAMSASEPGAVATGSSVAIAQPSDPQASLPTGQLATRTDIELPDSLRTTTPRSTSNSHHASRSARTNTATPQSGPPVFTDDPLNDPSLPEKTTIKALHITELRSAINALRARLELSAYSWQTSASTGGLIKADPILEMRTALDQALGPPPSPGYSPGLAQYQPILAVHIQELRNRVVAAWNSSSSIPRDGLASVSYDATSNRVTTAGFAYDAAGNQVRALIAGGASQRFQYDAANRLVNVKTDNNQTVIASYTYGDSNERLMLEEGGLRTYYACDGSAEYTESGGSTTPQWSKTYIYLGARLLSTLTPNGSGGEAIQYHHPDRLGTRLVTNAQDTNHFEQVTLPFGTALNAESSDSTNRRFTTYDRSLNTGLDYAINRHYDPQQGRFTQVDPIGMGSVSLSSPQTLNLYAYCTNDPINHIDPSGLGFISFLKKLLNRIVNALIHAAITAAFTFIFTGNPGAALAAGVADFLKEVGFPTKGFGVKIGGTPQWNPNAVSILSGGPSAPNRYIIYNLTKGKYNAQRVAQRVTELLSLISAILGEQWDAILNNKEDKQSFALSLCHAAQESGFGRVVQLNGQVQGIEGLTGDLGLFQIQLPTAQAAATRLEIGTVTKEQVRDNDALNTRLATNHLQTAIDRFGGDVRKGLGAYKQGVSGVLRKGLTVKSQEYADGVLQCEKRLRGSMK